MAKPFRLDQALMSLLGGAAPAFVNAKIQRHNQNREDEQIRKQDEKLRLKQKTEQQGIVELGTLLDIAKGFPSNAPPSSTRDIKGSLLHAANRAGIDPLKAIALSEDALSRKSDIEKAIEGAFANPSSFQDFINQKLGSQAGTQALPQDVATAAGAPSLGDKKFTSKQVQEFVKEAGRQTRAKLNNSGVGGGPKTEQGLNALNRTLAELNEMVLDGEFENPADLQEIKKQRKEVMRAIQELTGKIAPSGQGKNTNQSDNEHALRKQQIENRAMQMIRDAVQGNTPQGGGDKPKQRFDF